MFLNTVLKLIIITSLFYSSSVFAEYCPKYKRSLYGNWIDADGDSQSTQTEVLIAENLGVIVFKTDRHKEVFSGLWKCPFTGHEYSKISEVVGEKRKFYIDIDHTVPLGEAHESGAWKWSKEKKD